MMFVVKDNMQQDIRITFEEQDTLIVGSESVPLWYTAQYILAAAVWM